MKIIISPAKKMNVDTDSLEWRSLPQFLPQTELLLKKLQSMSYAELKKLWGCNDPIAQLNFERLKSMRLKEALTPAVLSYEGIQYKYMAPTFLPTERLSISSGIFALYRAFTGCCAPLTG